MMELQVNQEIFARGLQLVQSVVEPRQTLPILANVLLEASGEVLRISATDLEVAVRMAVPAVVSAPGGITLNARKLYEIVRELPPQVVKVHVQENSWVSLACGGTTVLDDIALVDVTDAAALRQSRHGAATVPIGEQRVGHRPRVG